MFGIVCYVCNLIVSIAILAIYWLIGIEIFVFLLAWLKWHPIPSNLVTRITLKWEPQFF